MRCCAGGVAVAGCVVVTRFVAVLSMLPSPVRCRRRVRCRRKLHCRSRCVSVIGALLSQGKLSCHGAFSSQDALLLRVHCGRKVR